MHENRCLLRCRKQELNSHRAGTVKRQAQIAAMEAAEELAVAGHEEVRPHRA